MSKIAHTAIKKLCEPSASPNATAALPAERLQWIIVPVSAPFAIRSCRMPKRGGMSSHSPLGHSYLPALESSRDGETVRSRGFGPRELRAMAI
jgi:hypothetical protein